ncbi:MAG: hypothetical protein ABR518_06925 [Actinomycetota bacterium]
MSFVLVAAISLAGCTHKPIESGEETPVTTGGSAVQRAAPQPQIDWEHPLGPDGVPLQSSVSSHVPFETKDPPPSIGEVQAIFERNPDTTPSESREIVWVIQGSASIFNLVERATEESQSQLADLAVCHPEEVGCDVSGWSLVVIGSSGPALLIDGRKTATPGPTSVTWIDDNVEYVVVGPSETFTAETAQAVAGDTATS